MNLMYNIYMSNQLQKHREEAFNLVFEAVRDYYPFINKKEKLNFFQKYKKQSKLISKIKKDDRFFFLFLEEFLASLKNAHTKLGDYPTKKFYRPVGLEVRLFANKFYLIRGRKALGEIISVDGLLPDKLLKKCSKRISSSTKQYLIYRSLMFILTDQSREKIKIVIKSGSKKRNIVLNRRPIISKPPEKSVEFRIIKADIGYLQIKTWTDQKAVSCIDKAVKFFKNKEIKSLIIDVRGNGGGDSRIAGYLAGHFFNRKVFFSRTKTRIKGQKIKYKTINNYVLPHKPYLDIPVVLLVDAACLSSNEYFIAGMKENKRAYLIGEKTGGSSGNPRKFKIPYGKAFFELFISTWIYFRPNEQTLEGGGIRPHLQIKPSLENFISNKDTALEKAKNLADNFKIKL